MTTLSQTILEKHQVRKTTKQKLAFIEFLRERCPQLEVQEGGCIKCRNIVIGNPEKADVILTAHYDTCAALPLPNFIAPKNPVLTLLYSLILIIPLFGIMLLVNWGLNLFNNYFLLNYFLSLAVYFGLLLLIILGPANKHTANDNTSGVIVLCELLARLPEDKKDKVAFVFFDHEESGLIGSGVFRKKYKNIVKDKFLINFDCVSDGDYMMLATTKPARELYGKAIDEAFADADNKRVMIERLEKVYYPSDHSGFPVALAVAALKKGKFVGYYMDRIHTWRDTVFDEKNIDLICTGILNFLENNYGTDSTEVL